MPINLRPSMASEGGSLIGRSGTIVSAEFRIRPWVDTNKNPVMAKFGPTPGEQQKSVDLFISIQVDDEAEQQEQNYLCGYPNIMYPANPDPASPTGTPKRAETGGFLVGIDPNTGADSESISLRKGTPFMLFLEHLVDAPGHAGAKFDESRLDGNIADAIIGINCEWSRIDTKGTNWIVAPTYLNRLTSEIAVNTAPSSQPAPPPPPQAVAGGTQLATESTVEDTLKSMIQVYLGTALAEGAQHTQTAFATYLVSNKGTMDDSQYNEIIAYMTGNPNYILTLGFKLSTDLVISE